MRILPLWIGLLAVAGCGKALAPVLPPGLTGGGSDGGVPAGDAGGPADAGSSPDAGTAVDAGPVDAGPMLNPASITGNVIAQALLQTTSAQVEVLLFTQDPSAGSPNPVLSAAVSPGSQVGTSYLFQGLAAGRYWVAAAWWPSTPTGNPSVISVARQNPIDLDPTVPSMEAATGVNVYLGECDPAGTGVDGIVTVGSSLATEPVGVAAYTQAITFGDLQSPSPPPVEVLASGDGAQRPFALCNLPPGTVNILAAAGTAGGGGASLSELVVYAMNPVTTSPLSHIALSLGEAATGQGSVGGTITLSGPLPGGSVTAAITGAPWSADAPFIGFTVIQTAMEISDTYSIAGLDAGTYYLTAIAKDDVGTTSLTKLDASFTISSTAPQANIALDVNVGRVHGNIDVQNAAGAQTDVIVGTLASAGAPNIVGSATVTLGPADSTGTSSAAYDVFGLADGSYKALALFEIDGSTTFQEAYEAGHYLPAPTMLPSVVIQGGSDLEVDFSGTVP